MIFPDKWVIFLQLKSAHKMIFPDKWVIILQLKQCTQNDIPWQMGDYSLQLKQCVQNDIPWQMGDYSAIKTVHTKWYSLTNGWFFCN